MESLDKRLAQMFVRGYALVLLVGFVGAFPLLLDLRFFPPAGGVPLSIFDVAAVVIRLPIAAALWAYSDAVGGMLAGSHGSESNDEGFQIPLELGSRLVGLVFLVRGFSGLAGEVTDWYVAGRDSIFDPAFGGPQVSDMVRLWFEAALGLVFFVGLDVIRRRVRSLRGMPEAAAGEDD